jgi:hypothetical protein
VTANHTAVTDVDATDPDSGDTVAYSISGGADQAKFSIVPTTGVLSFLSAPNFESPTDSGLNNVYDVTVSASDGRGGSDSQAIAVTVLNLNEFAPGITSDGGGTSVALSRPENSTAVTDVNATDGDGDVLTYSISGGVDAALFTIVPTTGVLTFVTAPNFEAPTDDGTNNVYDVVVDASDGSLSDTQAIAVTVTDVPENPPVINSDGGGDTTSVSVAENQTAVTDVDATDPDPGDTVTYSIFGGADQAKFSIVPTTGVLTFVSAPNFEAPTDAGANNVYDVTVRASDGILFDTQAIAVTVTDVVEGSGSQLYFTLLNAGTPGGVSVADEDVVFFDGTTFSLAFDGSDVGIASLRIDSFSWIDATRLLLSFDVPGTVPGIAGTTDDSDIVLFTSTSLGPVTAGTFSMYFDGTDVGLNTTNGEDVDAAAVDATGNIYLSTLNAFSVTGVSGADEDVFVFTPTTLGSSTTGTFSSTRYFDGSIYGLGTNDVFAIDLP